MREVEKLTNRQLQKYLIDNTFEFKHLYDFLPNLSTVIQLAFLVDKWQTAADTGQHIQAAQNFLILARPMIGSLLQNRFISCCVMASPQPH